MTDHAGLIERLHDGVPLTRVSGVGEVADTEAADRTMDEAASAIASLVKERDALKIESSKHAYEADKAKQDRDTAERRSEDFWSGRVASAEARCTRLEEALRPFHTAFSRMETEMFLSPDSLVVPDDMPIGLLFDETGTAIVTVLASDFRRARQALEEQG